MTSRTMTLSELGAWLEGVAGRLEQELKEAHRETLADAFRTAQAMSSGTVGAAALRRLDHPFARRHGAPLLNAAVINRQTGRFWESWAQQGPFEVAGAIVGRVFNTDPKARFLEEGTRFMFARPLPDAVVASVAPRFERRIEEAVVRAFGGG